MDVVAISESHLQGNETIDMEGYVWFGHNRQGTHIRAPKGSGGVGILVREELLQNFHVELVDKSYEGIIGIKLQHRISEYTVIVFSCYLPPENSTWGRDSLSFFSHLLSQIYLLNEIDAIVVCGDLNSRVGKLDDYIPDVDELSCRKIVDNIVNQHGKGLIEFLKESRLCMLNGRVGEEGDNDYTCTTSRGRSVVDYILTNHETIQYCSKFKVMSCIEIIDEHKLQGLLGRRSRTPDHSLLYFELGVNVSLEQPQERTDQELVPGHSERRYKVKDIGPNFMKSDICKQAILNLINIIECNNERQNEIDSIYDLFTNTVLKEMNKNVPYKDINPNSKRFLRPRKPFWNEELGHLWSQMNTAEKMLRRESNNGDKKLRHSEFKAKQHVFDRRFRFYERQYKYRSCENIEQLNT